MSQSTFIRFRQRRTFEFRRRWARKEGQTREILEKILRIVCICRIDFRFNFTKAKAVSKCKKCWKPQFDREIYHDKKREK